MENQGFDVIGPYHNVSLIVLAVCIVVGVAIICFFVSGVSRRIKEKSSQQAVWWITGLAAWSLIFSIMIYAMDMYAAQEIFICGDPQQNIRDVSAGQWKAWQAYHHLLLGSLVSLGGATARLVLKILDKENRQQ